MMPMLHLPEERRVREAARATEADAAHRAWRRSWLAVLGQIVGCNVAGYLLFGLAFHATDPADVALIRASAFAVGYLLPLGRLLVFHLRHGDDW